MEKRGMIRGRVEVAVKNLNSYIKSISKKERQLVFLDCVSSYLIPALVFFLSAWIGVPIVCFCDPGDGENSQDRINLELSLAPPEAETAVPAPRDSFDLNLPPRDDAGVPVTK